MTAMPRTRRAEPGSKVASFPRAAGSAQPEDGERASTAELPHLALELEPDIEAASRAREALEQIDDRVEGEVLDDLRLLVTELVTNSVRHSDAPREERVRVEVSVQEDRVRVSVEDQGIGFRPLPRGPDSPHEGGWGLHLVDQVSDCWGVSGDGGTRVWLELTRPRAGT
jgi:anti-sigma regulatory factor (Ser/Thr protein kinase)